MSTPCWAEISQEYPAWGGGARGQVCKGGDPGFRGAQGCSQALPVTPGLLLPRPVFSTGFVLLLPWELSFRECWVGWAGRPGQADGCTMSGPVPGVSREGLVHPTLSTAHPPGPGHMTALGAGRVFPPALQPAGCPCRAQGSPAAHLISRSHSVRLTLPQAPTGSGLSSRSRCVSRQPLVQLAGGPCQSREAGGPGRPRTRFGETSSLSHGAPRAEVLV